MEGDGFFRRVDMNVVAQPVEELGTVALRINRFHTDVLAKHTAFRTIRLGVDVHSLIRFPYTGQAAQRPQIGERIWRRLRFGVNVVGDIRHSYLTGTAPVGL